MEQESSTLRPKHYQFHTLEGMYVWDFVLLIVNVFGLTANFVIIYIVCRYKFWKISTYFCILNWTILDILRLLTSPGILRWYQKIDDVFLDIIYPRTYFCCTFAFQLGIILLLFILILKTKVKFFEQNYITLISIVWTVVFILLFLSVLGNIETLHRLHYSIIFTVSTNVVLIIVLFIVCIVFCAQQSFSEDYSRLILTLVGTYVFFWLSAIVILVISAAVVFHLQRVRHEYSILLVFVIAECCSLMNVYILQKIDKRFQLYLSRTFFCGQKREESIVTFTTEHKDEAI